MDRRLVDHLVNANIVSRSLMQRLILRASKDKCGVVEKLLEQDDVDEDAVAQELADYYEYDVVDPGTFSVDSMALKFLSRKMADERGVWPYEINDGADEVTVAVFDPEGASDVVDSLRTATGNDPTVRIATRSWLHGAIRHFYYGEPWDNAPGSDPESESESERKPPGTPEKPSKPAPAKAAVLGRIRPRSRSVAGQSGVVVDRKELKKSREDSTTEESAEIVLDEVVSMAPPPRRGAAKEEEPAPAEPELGSAQESEPDSVEAALEDFDAFLDSNKHSLGGGQVGFMDTPDPLADEVSSGNTSSPGWGDSGFESDGPFSFDDVAGGEPEEPAPRVRNQSGFDLFDEASEAGDTLHEIVARHEKTIAQLEQQLEQSRNVIQALVDELAEARVIAKRAIKRRLKK